MKLKDILEITKIVYENILYGFDNNMVLHTEDGRETYCIGRRISCAYENADKYISKISVSGNMLHIYLVAELEYEPYPFVLYPLLKITSNDTKVSIKTNDIIFLEDRLALTNVTKNDILSNRKIVSSYKEIFIKPVKGILVRNDILNIIL